MLACTVDLMPIAVALIFCCVLICLAFGQDDD